MFSIELPSFVLGQLIYKSSIMIIILLVLLLVHIIDHVSCTLSQIQYNSLKALYDSTGGSNWKSNCNNWVFDNDLTKPCGNNWYGITCSCTSSCTITSLSITQCNLQGSIPTEIGDLSDLDDLFLSGNSGLTGNIPSELYSLNKLVYLKLTYCAFTGKIATQVGNLVDLKILSLDSNKLSGMIPTQVCSLTNLETFSISFNSIDGMIPDCIGSSLSQLKYLFLYSNRLTGLNIYFDCFT